MRPMLFAGAAAPPWTPALGGVEDKLRELVKKGLVSLLTAFTNVGTAVIANRVIQAGTAPKFVGWGTGTTTAAVTQTDLVTEAVETLSAGRATAVETRATTTNTNDTNVWTAPAITATGSRAITEAATFDANSSGATQPNATGVMTIRGDFAAVNVVSGDSIVFTIKLKFAANAA